MNLLSLVRLHVLRLPSQPCERVPLGGSPPPLHGLFGTSYPPPVRSAPSALAIFSIAVVTPFESLLWVSLESLLYGALCLHRLR